MTAAPPIRRALVDLPVNWMGSPHHMNPSDKVQIGQKRPHSALEEKMDHVNKVRDKIKTTKYPGLFKKPQNVPSATLASLLLLLIPCVRDLRKEWIPLNTRLSRTYRLRKTVTGVQKRAPIPQTPSRELTPMSL